MFDIHLFASLVTAIVIEAAPFLLLGALVGAVVRVLVSREAMARLVPRSRAGQVACGLVAGMALPTCECGVVPVVRGLLAKGVPPAMAIPYMLAAPVINPVVLISTWVAFQGDWSMLLWRCVLVAIPASLLGGMLFETRGKDILRVPPGLDMASEHDHGHDCDCGDCDCHDHADHAPHAGGRAALALQVLAQTGREFLDMGRFLVFGAVVASLFKVLLPGSLVGLCADNVWLAVPAMLALAVLLSVCSEADAFVAAGFSMFPRAAQLGFVALGPMVDLKLIPMFYATFHRRVATALVVVPTLVVWVVSLALGLVGAM